MFLVRISHHVIIRPHQLRCLVFDQGYIVSTLLVLVEQRLNVSLVLIIKYLQISHILIGYRLINFIVHLRLCNIKLDVNVFNFSSNLLNILSLLDIILEIFQFFWYLRINRLWSKHSFFRLAIRFLWRVWNYQLFLFHYFWCPTLFSRGTIRQRIEILNFV